MAWWMAWLWRQLAKRRVDEHAERAAEPDVRALGGQERAVRAVVEDDVGAQQEAGGEDAEPERQPDRDRAARSTSRRAGRGRAASEVRASELRAERGLSVGGERGIPRGAGWAGPVGLVACARRRPDSVVCSRTIGPFLARSFWRGRPARWRQRGASQAYTPQRDARAMVAEGALCALRLDCGAMGESSVLESSALAAFAGLLRAPIS